VYRQFLLSSGNTRLYTWLEDDPRLKSGTELTLKGDDMEWTVVERYSITREDPPDVRWRVGGLV